MWARSHPWVTDPPLDDWFHGTRRTSRAEQVSKQCAAFSPREQLEVSNTLDGWFSDDLPDMNQEQPEVARYEIQNALWWVGMTGLDGIRQDTIQYMPREFIRDLIRFPASAVSKDVDGWRSVRTRRGANSFFIGGHKGWDGIDTKLDSVFDFALWNASLLVFTNKLPMRAVRDQLKYDALYPDASRVTMMANNHDTPRFMSLEGASLEGAMLHVAFTLSVRGIPQLYYGEEIAMAGEGDPDNRRDFPGGFPGDSRNAFTAQGRLPKEQRIYDWTRDWIRLRREHSAIRQGRLDRSLYDDDTYVFARQDKTETVIIAINRANKEKKISVPVGSIGSRDGAELTSLIGPVFGARVANGHAGLTIAARTAVGYKVR